VPVGASPVVYQQQIEIHGSGRDLDIFRPAFEAQDDLQRRVAHAKNHRFSRSADSGDGVTVSRGAWGPAHHH